MTTAQASIGQIGQRTETVFLAYHGLCEAARVYANRDWGWTGSGTKTTAGADDNSTGGRVSKAVRHGVEGWRGTRGCCSFVSLLGTGGDWVTGDEAATRRDEKGGGQQRPARSERARRAGRRNVS